MIVFGFSRKYLKVWMANESLEWALTMLNSSEKKLTICFISSITPLKESNFFILRLGCQQYVFHVLALESTLVSSKILVADPYVFELVR